MATPAETHRTFRESVRDFFARLNPRKTEGPTMLGEEPTPPSINGVQLAYPAKEDGTSFLISIQASLTNFFRYEEELWFPRYRELNEGSTRETGIRLVERQMDSESQRFLFEILTVDGTTIRVLSKRSIEPWAIFKLTKFGAVRFVKIIPGPSDFSLIEVEPYPSNT